jgi:hypothetical protein
MLHEHRRIGFGGTRDQTAGQVPAVGRTVEEHIFLDELPGSAGPGRVAESSLAFELFPDENLHTAPNSTAGENMPLAERNNEMWGGSAHAEEVGPLGRVRPTLLLLFFVAAALAAFGTVRACQVSGASSVAFWQLLGR